MPTWGGQRASKLTEPGSYTVRFKWIKQKGNPKFTDPSDRLTLTATAANTARVYYSAGPWSEQFRLEEEGTVLAGEGVISSHCRAWMFLRSLEKACQAAEIAFGYGDLSGVWVLELIRDDWFGTLGDPHILLVSKVYSREAPPGGAQASSEDAPEKAQDAPGATIDPSPDALATQVVNTLLKAAGGSYVLSEYTAGDMADLVPGSQPRALKVAIGRKALDREWLAEHGYIVDEAGKVLDKLPF